MKDKNKPGYEFRKEDFIPLVGLIKHHRRSMEDMFRDGSVLNKEYEAQSWKRDVGLIVYNSAVGSIASFVATGLVYLLFK